MVQRRHGKPAGQKKITDALKNAHNTIEAFYILIDGRFNLTDAEAHKIVSDWEKMQEMLRVHGKGAYAAPCQVAV